MQNYEFIKVLSSSETLALLLSIFAALYAFLAMYLIYLKRTKVKNQILSKFLDKKITMSEAQFLFSEVNNNSIMHLKNLNNDLDNDAKKMNKTLNKNCCNFDGFYDFYDFIKSVYLEERFLCNLFRGGLIAIVILFVILMLSIKEFFLIEDLNITSVVNRFLIVKHLSQGGWAVTFGLFFYSLPREKIFPAERVSFGLSGEVVWQNINSPFPFTFSTNPLFMGDPEVFCPFCFAICPICDA